VLDSLDFRFASELVAGRLYCCTKRPFMSVFATNASYLGGWIHVNADDVQIG
jgi:hypothetical protein